MTYEQFISAAVSKDTEELMKVLGKPSEMIELELTREEANELLAAIMNYDELSHAGFFTNGDRHFEIITAIRWILERKLG